MFFRLILIDLDLDVLRMCGLVLLNKLVLFRKMAGVVIHHSIGLLDNRRDDGFDGWQKNSFRRRSCS